MVSFWGPAYCQGQTRREFQGGELFLFLPSPKKVEVKQKTQPYEEKTIYSYMFQRKQKQNNSKFPKTHHFDTTW